MGAPVSPAASPSVTARDSVGAIVDCGARSVGRRRVRQTTADLEPVQDAADHLVISDPRLPELAESAVLLYPPACCVRARPTE